MAEVSMPCGTTPPHRPDTARNGAQNRLPYTDPRRHQMLRLPPKTLTRSPAPSFPILFLAFPYLSLAFPILAFLSPSATVPSLANPALALFFPFFPVALQFAMREMFRNPVWKYAPKLPLMVGHES